jgi:hypothetical protein
MKKMLRIGMALYFAALFLAVLPAHHHEDGVDQGDCVMCIIGNQAFTVQSSISLLLVVSAIIASSTLPPSTANARIPGCLRSRAPPSGEQPTLEAPVR